jgi:mono/diheme cytochrome c family protein
MDQLIAHHNRVSLAHLKNIYSESDMGKTVVVGLFLLAIAGICAVAGLAYLTMSAKGFSARSQPTILEAKVAKCARALAMPHSAKTMKNPIPASAEVFSESRTHFADHCALCHANNGSGKTMFGAGLYPKPPDLRAEDTQRMSDGEIYYVIENGIRLSGMPAFGGKDSADASWKLVDFIRHLPRLSAQEELEMERLNPKGPDEVREEMEEEQFLNGDAHAAPSKPSTPHHQK